MQKVLRDVFERSKEQKQSIETIYVDDCCKVRNKLKAIFGGTVQVKLDIFHAVQCVTRTLPKSHSLFHQCVGELRNVFCQDGDIGKERKCDTLTPDMMETKMVDFVKKWSAVCDSAGNTVFRADTQVAVNNIRKHIRMGCLSRIPPGGGTTKNERFHQHMRTLFHRSKLECSLHTVDSGC